jgi:subtilisin-like proprotein convertase family protein
MKRKSIPVLRSGKMVFAKILCVFALLAGVLLPERARGQVYWSQAGNFQNGGYLAIAPERDLNFTSGGFTLECWVRPSQSGQGTLIQKRTGSNSEGYTLYINSSGRAAFRTLATTRVVSGAIIPLNQWTHIAAVYIPSSVASPVAAIYINGQLDSSAAVSNGAPTISADSIRIGRGFNGNFNGVIDDVRLWSKRVLQQNINWNKGLSLTANTGIYDGLELSIPFQAATGSLSPFTVNDFSNGGNVIVNNGVTAFDMRNRVSEHTGLNRCVQFSPASQDYLAGAHTAALAISGQITLEAWVYPDSNISQPNGTRTIINKQSLSTSGFALRLLPDNRPELICNNTSLAAPAIPNRKWTHLAGVVDGNNWSIYVNGERTIQLPFSATPIANTTDSLYIGSRNGTSNFFFGFIDEVRISNYAKSDSLIRAHLWTSIDNANEPNDGQRNVVYNLDGYAEDNCLDGGPKLQFRNGAYFHFLNGAPLLRADADFPQRYRIKSPNRDIPPSGTISDTLLISDTGGITSIRLYCGIKNQFLSGLEVTLIAPNGDSVRVFNGQRTIDLGGDVVTLFDDGGDSLLSFRYTGFAPRVKPLQSLLARFQNQNPQGVWRLRVRDTGTPIAEPRVGELEAWGLSITTRPMSASTETQTPFQFRLEQNYPNPFNPSTAIRYQVSGVSDVRLEVFDVLGRKVSTLVRERKSSGSYQVNFNGAGLASGVYFYRLQAGSFVETKKMLLIK